MKKWKKKRPHVKIVLPCTDEGGWLKLTVDSILKGTRYPSYEVAISANGDTLTDFSFLDTKPYRGRVRLKRTPRRLGVGNGRNVAVRPGDAEVYVFFDAHCLVEQDDWLDRAVDCLEKNPTASMVQPEVQEFIYKGTLVPGAPPDPVYIEKLGYFAYATRWAWPYHAPSHLSEFVTHRQSKETYEGMAGAGMAIFARAETFHRLGKFDGEVSGWFYETLDYCVRGWLLGHPMLVEPTIRVLHLSKEGKPQYPRPHVHIIHGALRTAYKYLSPRRRDLLEYLLRKHGHEAELTRALEWVRKGNWLSERVQHLRRRVHDDDWLFERFGVYEEPLLG